VRLFPRDRRLAWEMDEVGVCGLDKLRDLRRGESGLNGLLDWRVTGEEGSSWSSGFLGKAGCRVD
jgi:hypothetical protein